MKKASTKAAKAKAEAPAPHKPLWVPKLHGGAKANAALATKAAVAALGRSLAGLSAEERPAVETALAEITSGETDIK